MYKNNTAEISFYVETYGCQMNVADSNEVSKELIQKGFVESNTDSDADIIIINTCSVRATAEQRISGRLGYFKKKKEQLKKNENKELTVVLMGCMAERLSRKLLEKFPVLDLVIGTHFKYKLADIISEYLSKNQKSSFSGFEEYKFLDSSQDKNSKFKAYVPIIKGCNNFCSYCIVPYTRGKEVSKPSEDIITNVKTLVNEGVVEITLLGQNVNSYGKDNNDINFANLLLRLCEIYKLKRIRFITSHPKDISKELIEVIANNDKVCKYLHLPFQSASDKVLADMNRAYSFANYREIISYIRKLIPKIALSTDILVGYPTETDKDYQMTIKAVKELRFDSAFMFKYSVREGTKASKLNDSVSEEVKLQRLQNLINIQNKITKEKLKERLGDIEEVLFESVSKNNKKEILGKTDTFNNVVVEGEESLIGQVKRAKLSKLAGNTFKGELG